MKAFLRKEWMELYRSGRFLILLLIFTLFGIMNPAVAKLTPWLMETLTDSLAESGLTVTEVTVDAMNSWGQFYKNIPAGIVVFILLCSSSFTGEYQKGTLIPPVTKGLSRRKILLAKALTMFVLWTVMYWLCFGITCEVKNASLLPTVQTYFWMKKTALSLISWLSVTVKKSRETAYMALQIW